MEFAKREKKSLIVLVAGQGKRTATLNEDSENYGPVKCSSATNAWTYPAKASSA